MATLTVEIDKERDLPELQAVFKRMGLKFHVNENTDEDDDDWGDLPEAAIEGIKAGMADVEAGRTHSHEYVMAEMNKKIAEFRKKNGQ
jgi:predicted transcriptional regulator